MSQLREQAGKYVRRAWGFAKRQSLKLAVGMGMFALSTGTALANSKGAGGFSKATMEISSYQTPVSNLMKAIAAVIVLVGAFNVYFKMRASVLVIC